MIYQGDCREIMPVLEANSIDAIICDPPYNLNFMNKAWDKKGIAYDLEVWRNCFRVLKPGGYLLSFGGSRTYHRMASAIEDSGFECRDMLEWCYGSGFPKSLNISKQLNQEDAKKWEGFGTALKPAHEPIGLFRKPLECKTVAENVLKWSTGAINVDATRIPTNGEQPKGSGNIYDDTKNCYGNSWHGTGGNVTPAAGRFPSNFIWSHSPNCKRIGTKKVKGDGHFPKHKPTIGDGIKYGKANPFDQEERFLKKEEVEEWECAPDCPTWEFAKAGYRSSGGPSRHPDKYSHDGKISKGIYHDYGPGRINGYPDADGSAARFFMSCPFTEEDYPAFIYVAKASRSEREAGLDGMPEKIGFRKNTSHWKVDNRSPNGGYVNDNPGAPLKNFHPTVKPLSLMRYLCRLITPPNGLILDPFAGSGTTLLAAKSEGFRAIGIELEPEYVEIAKKRLQGMPTRLDSFCQEAMG